MSKYVIELGEDVQFVQSINVTPNGNVYTNTQWIVNLEELNSDYINEHYGQLQDEAYKRGINDGSLDVKQRVEGAYQRGLDDAWEAARKVALNSNDGGLSIEKLDEIFDRYTLQQVLKEYTAKQAIEKLQAYEEKQKAEDEIMVGDEVKWNSDLITVTRLYDDGGLNWCDGIGNDGRAFHILEENVRKTGRHFDIKSILEEMRG